MIEIVSGRRCIACDICVKVCPANVFDTMPEAGRSRTSKALYWQFGKSEIKLA